MAKCPWSFCFVCVQAHPREDPVSGWVQTGVRTYFRSTICLLLRSLPRPPLAVAAPRESYNFFIVVDGHRKAWGYRPMPGENCTQITGIVLHPNRLKWIY